MVLRGCNNGKNKLIHHPTESFFYGVWNSIQISVKLLWPKWTQYVCFGSVFILWPRLSPSIGCTAGFMRDLSFWGFLVKIRHSSSTDLCDKKYLSPSLFSPTWCGGWWWVSTMSRLIFSSLVIDFYSTGWM